LHARKTNNESDGEEQIGNGARDAFTFLDLQQAPAGAAVPVLEQRVICIHVRQNGALPLLDFSINRGFETRINGVTAGMTDLR
jgi:hypothetical protein